MTNTQETPVLDKRLIKKVDVSKLKPDRRLQIRVDCDDDCVVDHGVVEEIANQMMVEDWGDIPPIMAIRDGQDLHIYDGFHRLCAARIAGIGKAPVHITIGSLEDAIQLACAANASHGLRRSNKDKRNAVETLMKLSLWRDKSSSEIAEHCRVGETLVRTILDEMVLGRKGKKADPDKASEEPAADPAPEAKEGPPVEPESEKEARSGRRLSAADDGIDKYKTRIPDHLIRAFGDIGQVNELISGMRSAMEYLESIVDEQWIPQEGLQNARYQAASVSGYLKSLKPHCICLDCKGDGCEQCDGRGVWNKQKHDARIAGSEMLEKGAK